jgi:hypothetical protein
VTDKPLYAAIDFGSHPEHGEWCARKANDKHERECPYKARADNDQGNEYAQVCSMKMEVLFLRDVISRIDKALRVPAAEYVPAITDVFAMIDRVRMEVK